MRYWFVFGIVCVMLALVSPAVALAAGDAHGTADKRPMGVEKGLFMGAVELSLWTILVFLILMSLLRKYAWGPIRDGLDKREHAIAHDKLQAVKAREEADALRAQFAAQMAKANDEVRVMMDKARQDAEALAAEREAQSKAEMAAEKERQERDLQRQAADAKHQMMDQSAHLATLISAKVIKKQLQYDDHRALLGEALAEFRQSLEGRKHDIESARA